MSLPRFVIARHGRSSNGYARHDILINRGERPMKRPDTPFPRHWLYYIAIKLVVILGALALALKLYGNW